MKARVTEGVAVKAHVKEGIELKAGLWGGSPSHFGGKQLGTDNGERVVFYRDAWRASAEEDVVARNVKQAA